MWLNIGMVAVLGLVMAFGGLVWAVRRRNPDVMVIAFGTLVLVYALGLAIAWEHRLLTDRISALEAQAKQQPAAQNTTEQK